MATVTNFANAFETTLTADMLGTDLTAQVQTTDGAPASPCYLVIDPHNDDKREYALFDGTFGANSFVTTALANRYLDGSAAASGITHAAGAIVRFSPVAQHFRNIQNSAVWLDEAQTISGAKTFSVDPTLADGSSALSLAEGNAAYRRKTDEVVINAVDHGVTADGTTDDRVSLLAALDAANAIGGDGTAVSGSAKVVLPEGTIRVTAGFDLTGYNKLHIQGAGMQATHILLDDGGLGDLFYGAATSASPDGYVEFSDFTARGPGQGTGTGRAFDLTYFNPLLTFRNVQAYRWGADGWFLRNCFEGSASNCYAQECGAWGFNLDRTNDSFVLKGCFSSNNTTGNYRMADGWQGPWLGCWSYGSPVGILLEQTADAGVTTGHAFMYGPQFIGGVHEGYGSSTQGFKTTSAVARNIRGLLVHGLSVLTGTGTLVELDDLDSARLHGLFTRGSGTPATSTHVSLLAGCSDVQFWGLSQEQAASETLFSDSGSGTLRAGRHAQPFAVGTPMVSGNDYGTPATSISTSFGTTNERMYSTPFVAAKSGTISRASVRVGTAGETGSVIRLGLYDHDPATGKPGALVKDWGTTAADVTGERFSAISNATVEAGRIYWLVAVTQLAPTTPPDVYGVTGHALTGLMVAPANFDIVAVAYFRDTVSGALPDPFGAATLMSGAPRVKLRVP